MTEQLNERLTEIRDVLLTARNEAAYNMGSPEALDHLLVHVCYVIEAILKDGESNDRTD